MHEDLPVPAGLVPGNLGYRMNVCEALGPPGSSGELGPKDPYWLAHLTNPPYPKEGWGEGEWLVTRWSDALAWQDSGWNMSELVTPPSLACC